jgi:deoxyinosine 3'endonuclease (endonuclease V)
MYTGDMYFRKREPIGIGLMNSLTNTITWYDSSLFGEGRIFSVVGVAKNKLFGDYQEPKNKKGSTSPVTFKGEQIGIVLRSRENVKLIFVSPGHLSDLDRALSLTMQTLTKYKLPEPTRIADHYSKILKPML